MEAKAALPVIQAAPFSRRDMLARAGIAFGGAVALGALSACGKEDPNDPQPQVTGPQVADFPYEQHLQAGYQLDAAAVREAAYHAYYAGGCCHGAYSALLGHLASTAGAPFDLLPLDFGKFGGGGIASYGSICGALLGGVLVTNMIVADPAIRGALMTDLMRWYEGNPFPAYLPAAVDAAETGLTKDFASSNIATMQLAPNSHLCHASVSSWCSGNQVAADGADKKARCARLTADVAGKMAEMLNTYLSTHAYTAAGRDGASATCMGCHAPSTTTHPVAAGMACTSCHADKTSDHPTL